MPRQADEIQVRARKRKLSTLIEKYGADAVAFYAYTKIDTLRLYVQPSFARTMGDLAFELLQYRIQDPEVQPPTSASHAQNTISIDRS